MTIDTKKFQKLLNEFQLNSLFVNELGWDKPNLRTHYVEVNGHTYSLTHVAHKRGVSVLLCSPDEMGDVPPRATLLKIEKEATKLSYEHLLIFANAEQKVLTWLWVARVPGKPAAIRTHTWHKGTSGESLRQKLNQIVWSLEEEEAITLTDVIQGLRSAFDRDRVSKRFYDHFKTEHQAFSEFIEGIDAVTDQAWYASLMLNRLMFVYFIQQKGFLDGNPKYLSERMEVVRKQAGKGKFHTFYRQFLRRLFHEGLGQHKKSRVTELSKLIGDVPYLNGGLFDVHELGAAHPDIDIPDEAFQRLFAFFDAYAWHLDDRPLSSGSEINPDVLGYIFEKYINQKQMGAFYTKEDITEYISKNTVIPHLLGKAKERCIVAFEGSASIWSLLKVAPDRYIYPAMKTGVIDQNGKIVPISALPDFVQLGIEDPNHRIFDRRYNLGEALFDFPNEEYQNQRGSLPTETWREYAERRNRCLSLRDKLIGGEIKSVEDLITLNLDMRQFMQDVIDTCSSPDLLRAIWQSIVGHASEKSNEKFNHGIAILDPTCGSGAFLFAALNVLEPLYEACLDRMESFVEDAKKLGKLGEADFINVLEEVDRHHSRNYFIYKNIILHNLFGVDIMAEAVEICKLRLFLKLVSQVDAGRELEPLPDIDFNIRTGNTLVGFATEYQFDASNTLASDQSHREEIKSRTSKLSDDFNFFRQQQTVHGGKVNAEDKRTLRTKLSDLSLQLDKYLAYDYGVNPLNESEFSAWQASHQPFHWFSEFYSVMKSGGFDVVIGNPPYVAKSKISYGLMPRGMSTTECSNIYAPCMEQALVLLKKEGLFGMIVPVSLVSGDGYQNIANLCGNHINWLSSYSNRPGKLFDGVEQRLTICLLKNDNQKLDFSSSYQHWYSSERETLLQKISYHNSVKVPGRELTAKIGNEIEKSIFQKITSYSQSIPVSSKRSKNSKSLWYHDGPTYWIRVLPFDPDGNKSEKSSHYHEVVFQDNSQADLYTSILASSLFYFFFKVVSNCRDFGEREITMFKLPKLSESEIKKLGSNVLNLKTGLQDTAKKCSRKYKSGIIEYYEYYPAKCKSVLDLIDLNLAGLFNLSSAEIDFIINYDIKYRIGVSDDEE